MKFVISRAYTLKINNVATEHIICPKSSVPQGSHCGPVLFVIYINDITINEEIEALFYADDAKFYRIVNKTEDRRKLQDEIFNFSHWARRDGLKLNASKTFHMSYGPSKCRSIYYLNNSQIQKISSVRDLGVYFDKKLNFKMHISQISKRTGQMIGVARRFIHDIRYPMLILNIYNVLLGKISLYIGL